MSWLVRERPDLRCDFSLNEGGGELLELADGRRFVTVSVGEKQVTSLRIRAFGAGGHASVPADADNPLSHLGSIIESLQAHRPPARVGSALEQALRRLGIDPGEEGAVARAAELHPRLVGLLPATAAMTVTPTGVASYEPANVIPPYADVICDCRTLPGEGLDQIEALVREAIGDGFRWELELLEPLVGGTESPIDTPLFAAIERYVADRLPGAEPLPLVTPGFTDSHWVRSAWSTVAYGFAPVFSMGLDDYHAGVHARRRVARRRRPGGNDRVPPAGYPGDAGTSSPDLSCVSGSLTVC